MHPSLLEKAARVCRFLSYQRVRARLHSASGATSVAAHRSGKTGNIFYGIRTPFSLSSLRAHLDVMAAIDFTTVEVLTKSGLVHGPLFRLLWVNGIRTSLCGKTDPPHMTNLYTRGKSSVILQGFVWNGENSHAILGGQQ